MVRMVRNIEVKRIADAMKISFFNSTQYVREITRVKVNKRKFTHSSPKN